MAYQPLSNLISQSPTTKELHITTDNWPEERKKLKEVVKDPRNDEFNWWFWCGIYSKKDLESLVKDYKEISGSLIKFKDMKDAKVNSWFKGKIKNKIHNQLMIDSINQINVDLQRLENSIKSKPEVKKLIKNADIVYRILYTIFSQRYISIESYSQTDLYYLIMVFNIIDTLKQEQVDIYNSKKNASILKEILAYCLLKKLLDLKISQLYTFPKTKKITISGKEQKISLVKKKRKNFLIEDFFSFLFTSMFFKFANDTKTKQIFNKDKKTIFSKGCDYWRSALWSQIPFFGTDMLYNSSLQEKQNITVVIGETLVNNDLIYYIIYLLAYWCEYFKYDNFSGHPVLDDTKSIFIQQEWYGIVPRERSHLIYKNSLPIQKYNEIKRYLLKQFKTVDGEPYTKLDKLAKLARSKRTLKEKNGHPIVFKFPSKLFNKKQKGGRRKTVKHLSNLRKRTVKNSNYLFR